jgi:DNA-binding XRE family transcriptional regulator
MLLSVEELARIVGCSSTNLCRWEYNRSTPTLTHTLALGAALHCPIEILFLEEYRSIRKAVRRRMADLPAKRHPDFRSCQLD